jgi:ABC-type glutathione transport system ATPase component
MTADLSTERQTLDIAETGDVLDAAEVVQTDGLTKRFGDTIVVGDVDLRVPRGTTFGYLGPNGAGKTTLIRMLLGLVRPTRGRAKLLGLPVPAERRQALARVGAIVDEPRLNGHRPAARTCGRSLLRASRRHTRASMPHSSGSDCETAPTTPSPSTRWGCGSDSVLRPA